MRAKITGALLAKAAGAFDIWDDELRGLRARRQTPGGPIVYSFRYTDASGQKRNVRIGDASHFSPAEARRRAGEEARKADPAAARDAARADKTLAEVWADYLARVIHKKAPATQANYASLWARHLAPRLGAKRVSAITTGDVEDMHKAITELAAAPRAPGAPRAGGGYAANRAKALLSILLNRAKVSPNPCRDAEGNEEFRRGLVFTDGEISYILAALRDEDLDVRIAFNLFLTSAVRHKTVASAEWEEFRDLGGAAPFWQIPRAKLKGKGEHDHIVWLSGEIAADVLAWRQRKHNESPRYLFPLEVELREGGERRREMDPARPRASYRSAWERIRARALTIAGAEAVHCKALRLGTIHTFKHSYLTRFADVGAGAAEIQAAGDHQSIQTSMGYLHGERKRLRDLHAAARASLPKAAA